jgi:hypothetical protein
MGNLLYSTVQYGNESNLLKYVCKRLYHETRGLNLHFNVVIFEHSMNALGQCAALLKRCNSIRAVAIKCPIQSFMSNCRKSLFSKLFRDCPPNILVKIYIPYWSQADPSFIQFGLNLLSALRAATATTLVTRLARIILPSYSSDAALELLPTPVQIPDNIRFFPNEERFDQQAFEHGCRRNPRIRLPAKHAEIGEVVEIVGDWFENGL